MSGSCVVDASIFLNLGPVRGLPVLFESKAFQWKLTPIVRSEVRHPESRSILERALLDGTLELVELDTTSEAEMKQLARYSTVLDAGEAEALALAVARSWSIALEDRKAQRIATEAGVKWVNCANILLAAIREGQLSVEQADDLFTRLSCYASYRKRAVNNLLDLHVDE